MLFGGILLALSICAGYPAAISGKADAAAAEARQGHCGPPRNQQGFARTQSPSNPRVMVLRNTAEVGLFSSMNHHLVPLLLAAHMRGLRLVFGSRPWAYGCGINGTILGVFDFPEGAHSYVEPEQTVHDILTDLNVWGPNLTASVEAAGCMSLQQSLRESSVFMLSHVTSPVRTAMEDVLQQLPQRFNALHARVGDKMMEVPSTMRESVVDPAWWARQARAAFGMDDLGSAERLPIRVLSGTCEFAHAIAALLPGASTQCMLLPRDAGRTEEHFSVDILHRLPTDTKEDKGAWKLYKNRLKQQLRSSEGVVSCGPTATVLADAVTMARAERLLAGMNSNVGRFATLISNGTTKSPDGNN